MLRKCARGGNKSCVASVRKTAQIATLVLRRQLNVNKDYCSVECGRDERERMVFKRLEGRRRVCHSSQNV